MRVATSPQALTQKIREGPVLPCGIQLASNVVSRMASSTSSSTAPTTFEDGPKYHLKKTIRPLTEVPWVWDGLIIGMQGFSEYTMGLI